MSVCENKQLRVKELSANLKQQASGGACVFVFDFMDVIRAQMPQAQLLLCLLDKLLFFS